MAVTTQVRGRQPAAAATPPPTPRGLPPPTQTPTPTMGGGVATSSPSSPTHACDTPAASARQASLRASRSRFPAGTATSPSPRLSPQWAGAAVEGWGPPTPTQEAIRSLIGSVLEGAAPPVVVPAAGIQRGVVGVVMVAQPQVGRGWAWPPSWHKAGRVSSKLWITHAHTLSALCSFAVTSSLAPPTYSTPSLELSHACTRDRHYKLA